MSRDKENYARIEALLELLVSAGTISRKQADSIIQNRDFQGLHKRAREARRTGGPPGFAGHSDGKDNGRGPGGSNGGRN